MDHKDQYLLINVLMHQIIIRINKRYWRRL